MRLEGKVALVTGAQQGIGRAIALAFGREGARVVVNYLDNRPSAETVVAQIRDLGSQAILMAGDVSRIPDVHRIVEAGDELGGIDVLVNNAGIFPRVNFLDMTEVEWHNVLDVNLKGAFLCAQTVARRLVSEARRGAMINLASGAAFRSSPGGVHYVASKAGIVGLTRAVAMELAGYHIRVNAIAPGLTDTAQPRYGMSEEDLQETARLIPLGRMATPEDIAELAVFLAAEESRHITGQTIHVNGGQYLY